MTAAGIRLGRDKAAPVIGVTGHDTGSFERCSACGSDAVHHRQKRGDWICDDCEFVWSAPLERPAKTQKSAVFISYGHSDAPGFARKLSEDLGAQGFRVWLDIDSLGAGSEWDVRIEAGIKASRVLLATITPASVREDSICRDEVILAHSQGKVIVPLRASTDPRAVPTLLLVRRNWLDFTGEYGAAFGRLVRFLEGDEQALEAPLASVVAGLVPLDFGPELARHSRGFVGRKWMDRELDGWLADSRRRAFIVVGEPGIGKSAIAAHFATTRSEIAAIHFCTTRNTRIDPLDCKHPPHPSHQLS